MKDKNKMNFLEGLRGILAINVILCHFVDGFYPAFRIGNPNELHTAKGVELTLYNTPFNLLYNGNFAVCAFFILSGYLVCYKFFKYKESSFLISTAIKRYFRLLLPVLFSILCAYILMKSNLFFNKQASLISKSEWWLATFWNFNPTLSGALYDGFIGALLQYSKAYNPLFWAMTYEFYGSLLVIGIASVIGELKNRYIIYLVAIFIFINSYYLAFILGLILSDLHNNRKEIFEEFRNPFLKIMLLMIGLLLASYPVGISVQGSFYERINIPMISNIQFFCRIIGAFLIIFSILTSNMLKKLLCNKILVFIGQISFSIYAIQIIIIGSYSSYMLVLLTKYYNYKSAFTIMASSTFLLIILVAYFMNRYIDSFGIKLSNLIYKKFFSNSLKNNIDITL